LYWKEYINFFHTPVLHSGVTRGAREDICPRGQHFWGAKLRSGCHVIITKCQISAGGNIYDLQNVECQRLVPNCEILSRSPRLAKRSVTNLSDVFKVELLSSAINVACGLTRGYVTMLSESQVCDLTFTVHVVCYCTFFLKKTAMELTVCCYNNRSHVMFRKFFELWWFDKLHSEMDLVMIIFICGYLNKCWLLLQHSNCNCATSLSIFVRIVNISLLALLLHVFYWTYKLIISMDMIVEIQVTKLLTFKTSYRLRYFPDQRFSNFFISRTPKSFIQFLRTPKTNTINNE